jgi:hypothetical protein
MRVHAASFALLLALISTPGIALAQAAPSGSELVPARVDRPALELPADLKDPFELERELYLEGTPAEVSRALRRFVAAGAPGVAAAARLVAANPDGELQDQHRSRLRSQVQRQLANLIVEGDLDGAQSWLEALAAGRDSESRRELATFLALTGRAKTALDDPLLEAWRLRAAGDPFAARGHLERRSLAGEDATALRFAVAFDLEDWSSLGSAALQAANEGGDRRLSHLGLAAAAFRAAGDVKRAEDCDARLSVLVAKQTSEPIEAAVTLLLNDRAEEALPLLLAAGEPDAVFNLLSAEWRYREALELAETIRDGKDLPAAGRAKLEARVARLLSSLAEPAGAKAAIEAHATWSAQDRSPTTAAAGSIGLELRAGLEEAAFARAAAALDALAEGEQPRSLLGAIFPRKQSEAEVVWTHVSEAHPDESSAQLLARCATFLQAGSADPAELSVLQIQERERAGELERAERARWYRGLSALAERHGNEKLAMELVEAWNAAEERYGARDELAERLAQAGEWARAAELWQEAFRANPGEPGPLALAGWALTEAGWPDAGEELKLQASLIALGDGGRRYRLAGVFQRNGLFEDAHRERMTLLRTQAASSWSFGATLRQLAGHASCAGASADAAHWSVPSRLQAFLDGEKSTPGLAGHWARRTREAHVTLAAEQGDARGAFVLADEALGPWLRDLDLTAHALAGLDDAGYVPEAERLSWRLLDRLRQVSDDFPNSAAHANAHATLAARTERDLDAALVTAGRAVELRPQACAYRSTLAEVLFARGETDEAVRTIETVLEHCSKSEKYQQQRLRFGGGVDSSATGTSAD